MRHLLLLVAALLAAPVVGCKNTLPTKLVPGQAITVRGELAPGAECPMLVTAEGRRFSLAGDLGRFKTGDRACVMGTVAEISFCMAGEATISIAAIGPADSCP
ncbi:MAG: DUF5818 domain-containing protein [Candidatus Eiseniibacteriota bacterium]